MRGRSPLSRGRTTLVVALLLSSCTDYGLWLDADDVDAPTGTQDPHVFDTHDHDPGDDTGEAVPDECDPIQGHHQKQEIADECSDGVVVDPFAAEIEWRKDTFSERPDFRRSLSLPIVAPLSEDGPPAIIFITAFTSADYEGVLRAVSGADGTELWTAEEYVQTQGGPAAADIDGDGYVEIVAPTLREGLVAFEHDGTLKWRSEDLGDHIAGSGDQPSIADMDGDGSPEIIVGNAILNADGTTRALGEGGIGGWPDVASAPVAVDLDGDGVQEVVTGNTAYSPDGEILWSNGEWDGLVAIGNFDEDDDGEVAVAGSAEVRLQDTDGTVLWRAFNEYGMYFKSTGAPTIADFDADGEPEIGVATRYRFIVYDADGSELWSRVTQDWSSGMTGSSAFDFDGDGVGEVVYADESRLWVYAGPNGDTRFMDLDHEQGTWLEYALVADVDGDDEAEIVATSSPFYNPGHGVTVWGSIDGSWPSARRIWNQHAYHITNIEDDGTVPAVAERNWDSWNSFRAAEIGPPPEADLRPDLVVEITEVCTWECDDGRLHVGVRVGNRGIIDVPGPVEVRLLGWVDGEEVSLGVQEVATAESGRWEAVTAFVVDRLDPWTIEEIRAVVDIGHQIEECDETNNEDLWLENLCL